MEKSKLGIVINTTKANNRTSGFRSIYNYNSDEWSSIVRDTGAELKKVTNNAKSDPIHLIQFVSDGCCYCIMKPIAGRNDYQSAWIFIHKDINLPKGILSSVIKKIEEVLSLEVEDKKAELDGLFSKTYPTSESPSYPPSSGDTYAVRYYGDGTNLMYDGSFVLEDFLYQYVYCKYKSVFLVDKAKGQTVSDAIDLSDTKLQRSVVIELPEEIDGFKHNLGSNSIRVTEGTSLIIKWTRSGYAPIEKQGKSIEELLINRSEYKKSFRLNLFRVIDKVTKKDLNAIPNFLIQHWVDDRQNPRIFYFREEDLKKVSCHVDKATYHSFSGEIDLTKPNENGEYVIELQPEEHIYNCYISTNIPDRRQIDFVIKTQYKLRGNEIPGFRFDSSPSETRGNKLKAAPQQTPSLPVYGGNKPTPKQPNHGGWDDDDDKPKKPKKVSLFKSAIILLLLVILIGGGYTLYKYFFPDKPKHEYMPEIEVVQYKTEWEQALDYLSGNNAYWSKSEMESYSELSGVYAMIKDFQFKELKSFIENHPDLKSIDSWNRLYEIASKFNNKKGTFKTSDDRIDIEAYLKTDFESKEDVSTQTTSTSNLDTGSHSSAQGGSSTNGNANSHGQSNGSGSSNSSGSSNNTNTNPNSQDKYN